MSSPHDSSPRGRSEKNRLYDTRYDNLAQQDVHADHEADRLPERDHDVEEEKKRCLSRRLYGILTLMSLVLFTINLIQVCLLGTIINWYWLILFPGLIFLGFMGWAGLLLLNNRSLLAISPGEVTIGTGVNKLAKTYPSTIGEGDIREASHDRRWPKRLSRAGIVLTIILNVILVEFIYFPIFAVPGFKTLEWKVALKRNSNTLPVDTPAVAVIQYGLSKEDSFRTALPSSNSQWENVCQTVAEQPFDEVCISNHTETARVLPGGEPSSHIRYAIFDPTNTKYSQIPVAYWIGLWYPFYYHSESGIQVTRFGFFDRALIPHFIQAYQCGLVKLTDISTLTWNLVDLEVSEIDDEVNAMDREGECKIPAFKKFKSYQTVTSYIGNKLPLQGSNNCDLSFNAVTGPCTGSIQINFPSGAETSYKSQHHKTWISILTEEGGVVGFVTFLTWFCGIFEA